MPSQIAWLDASSEEQRRMRDIIKLFTDRESRDELGLGTIRDPLGDLLFPGSSTLHTRARYLLVVPWIYARAAGRKDAVAEADRLERNLIAAVKRSADSDGLLGGTVGDALRNLPSSIYWSALGRYGIRNDAGASRVEALATHGASRAVGDLGDDAGRTSAWHATLPVPPDEFPRELPGGFALRAEEAEWLRERILAAAPGTLLAHLTHDAPGEESQTPWEESAALRVDGPARQLLDDARAFSSVVHGAQLLYNLVLAEQYEQAGYDRLSEPATDYRQRLEAWADGLPELVDVDAWNLEALITRVEVGRGRPVPPRTRRFVTRWTQLVRDVGAVDIPDSPGARALVADREREGKGAQARIGNPKRLAGWLGGSGAGALTYRWGTVRRLLVDIHEGLGRGEATAGA